jgi:hypothetical protein
VPQARREYNDEWVVNEKGMSPDELFTLGWICESGAGGAHTLTALMPACADVLCWNRLAAQAA